MADDIASCARPKPPDSPAGHPRTIFLSAQTSGLRHGRTPHTPLAARTGYITAGRAVNHGEPRNPSPASRVVFRIVLTNPPSLHDFTSNAALRKTPQRPDPEVLRLWDGLSVFASEAQARRQARRLPFLGSYIAEMALPINARCERTRPTPGHHTVWGNPAMLLACVVRVVPV